MSAFSGTPRASARVTTALLLALLVPAFTSAAARYDPRLRFQRLTTAHFVIYFHQGEEPLARRLAIIAEEARAILIPRIGGGDGRTHVILVDQTDLSNGWANPLPYNTIEMTAVPPAADSSIGNTDDWLALVFTHEYTHILHLEQSRRWAAAARRVFGRIPFAFPNLYLPQWQIEGLATYFESAVTHHGRMVTGDFARLFEAEVRAHGPQPMDRANGGLVAWPGGGAGYVYGAYFHDFLARRFGEERLASLARRTSGAVPYKSGADYAREFGRDLDDLWREFQIEFTSVARPEPFPATAHRLTHHGFAVLGPRWDPSAAGRVVYSVRNAHGFPALMAVTADTGKAEKIISRYLGDRVAVSRDAIYFDQLDFVRSVALQSDLYRIARTVASRGIAANNVERVERVERLTRGARAVEPDLSPDGRTLACLVVIPGGRALATIALDPGAARAVPERLLSEPDGEFSSPRWSPDGRSLAVERRRLHGPSELMTIDVRTREVRVLVSSSDARNVTPAWTPDGRTILFASDRQDEPFNLFAVDVATGAQSRVTDLPGGASSPDVSPDGASIVYVGYTPEGQDLFMMPLDRSAWRGIGADGVTSSEAPPQTVEMLLEQNLTHPVQVPGIQTAGPSAWTAVRPDSAAGPTLEQRAPAAGPSLGPQQPSGAPGQRPTERGVAAADGAAVEGYSPWQTIAPRFWTPIFEYADDRLRAGGATAGLDVLGRHYYAGTVLWGADGARPDWFGSYLYDRWRPSLFLVASDEAVIGRASTLRDLTLDAGVVLPFRRVRRTQSLFAAVRGKRDVVGCRREDAACDASGLRRSDRNALRFGWQVNTARNYGYSVSAQDGVTATVTSEHVLPALGAEGRADALTADVRAFATAGGRHAVLAARLAAGTGRGDAVVRRRFSLGGSQPRFAYFDFGSDALSLLRGYHSGDVSGPHAVLLNVDYRVPLLRVERGRGLWPVFLRWIHGSVFVDAGHAWDDRFSWRQIKTSAGAELSLDTVVAYFLPLTATVGVAWRHDGAGQLPGGAAAYFRIGRAF